MPSATDVDELLLLARELCRCAGEEVEAVWKKERAGELSLFGAAVFLSLEGTMGFHSRRNSSFSSWKSPIALL